MCDRSNAQQIVAEMLNYLETADYSIREEIVSFRTIHLSYVSKLSMVMGLRVQSLERDYEISFFLLYTKAALGSLPLSSISLVAEDTKVDI